MPRDIVEDELERILARPEFSELDSAGDERLGAFLEQSASASNEILAVLVDAVPFVLGLLAAWFLWRLLRRAREPQGGPVASGRSQVRERVVGLLADAREARGRGETRLALRLYLFALVAGLGAKGDLAFRAAWTNRELLHRGDPGPQARALLEGLIDELEPKEFGDARVEERDLDRLEALCAHHLASLLTPSKRGVA